MSKYKYTLPLLLLFPLLSASCKDEPMEEAGETVDEFIDDSADALDDAADEVEDAVDDAKDEVDG